MGLKQIAAIVGGLFICSSASAATLCAMRDDLVAVLARDYGESLAGQGLTDDGQLVELFVGDRRSFTLIITASSGVSCMLLAGGDWEQMKKPVSESPDSLRRMR